LYGKKEGAFQARSAEHPHPADIIYLNRSDYHPFHDHLSGCKVKPINSEDVDDFIKRRAVRPQSRNKG
jgi:hypothetical protein